MIARHDERLDGGATLALVEGGPHNDMVGSLARGHEDLGAVEHVLVAVEAGGGGHCRRVGTEVRFGDGHGGPHAAELLHLLLVRHGGDRGVAQALAGDREREADVSPAGLDDVEQRLHVAAVGHALALGGTAGPHGGTGGGLSGVLHGLHHGFEGVQLDGVLVLREVVLAGDRAEDLGGDLAGLVGTHLEPLGKFEVDHGQWSLDPRRRGWCGGC